MSYIELETNVDQGSLLQDFYDFMADRFPGWVPAAANPEAVLAEGFASLAAETLDLAADVPDEIFMQFGRTIVNIPPQEAARATADTTWTLIDDAGYTIEEGTQIAISDPAGEPHAFEVDQDVVVLAGATATAAGEVAVTAIEEGAAASGLTAAPDLLDSLDFVGSIALVGATAGGEDAEDPVAYRDRLARELQLMAPRPILPNDFAVLVRDNVAGIARAVAIDGYDPGSPGTYDPADPLTWTPRMIAIAGTDAAGANLSVGVKAAADAYLQSQREVSFVVNMIDPSRTTVDVQYTVKGYPTFDPAALEATVDQALTDYLSPINWGKPLAQGDDPGAWLNATKVRYLEVAEVINRVDGVDYIVDLQIRVAAGAFGTADLDLAGAAPLTEPGAITGTVT